MTGLGPITRLERAAYQRMLRPLLFKWGGGDPEAAHDAMIKVLSAVPASRHPVTSDPVTVAGIRFPNRVGLAAGLDKDGRAAASWGRFGFGFAELGTVTGKPQPGNPSPRVFRLRSSGAIINRMGFNNEGSHALAQRLRDAGVRRGNMKLGIPLGVSIGKTKSVPLASALDDYLVSLRHVARYTDYVAINVSSPNTPGLRTLQGADEMSSLIAELVREAHTIDPSRPVPIFVKLSPDMEGSAALQSLDVIAAAGASGVIATNTTLRRSGLHPSDQSLAVEAGGLSGAPLTRRALEFVELLAPRTQLPIMGVGGIMTPQDAARMFAVGATLVQLYTGFIYEGPALVRAIQEVGGPA